MDSGLESPGCSSESCMNWIVSVSCLLTLEDTVKFFNLVLELKLSAQEKKDLPAFLWVL